MNKFKLHFHILIIKLLGLIKRYRLLWDAVDLFANSYLNFILFIIKILPGRPGNLYTRPLRYFLVRLIGVKIGQYSQVSPGFFLYNLRGVSFGRNCSIGYNFKLWNFKPIQIGDNFLASHNITIISATHDPSDFSRYIAGDVLIGDNVWIGANVVIVGPCQIGSNVIIGANSFVRGNLKDSAIYAGSPAKFVKFLN